MQTIQTNTNLKKNLYITKEKKGKKKSLYNVHLDM